jgi:hypothetical protein
MISNLGFQKRERNVRLLCCVTCFLWCTEEFRRHAVKIHKCNFSHCFPECENSVFSEMSVAYQTTRIPRSEFWYVPASLNCDFDMYLQVWTVILKCTCKWELWASLMHKTFHLCGMYLVFCLWFAGFVMSLLENSFQCQILFLPTYLMQ